MFETVSQRFLQIKEAVKIGARAAQTPGPVSAQQTSLKMEPQVNAL